MPKNTYKIQIIEYEKNKKILKEIEELGEITINEFAEKRKINYNLACRILTNLKKSDYLKINFKRSKKNTLDNSLRNYYSTTEKKLIEPKFV